MAFVLGANAHVCRARAAHHPVCRQALPLRMSMAPSQSVSAPLVLNLADDTRLSFRFGLEQATALGEQVNALIMSFKATASAAKHGERVVGESLDFHYQDDSLHVSVECNPNLFPNAFSAKVYIVIDDGNIRVSSQALLTQLIDNVKAYKAQLSA